MCSTVLRNGLCLGRRQVAQTSSGHLLSGMILNISINGADVFHRVSWSSLDSCLLRITIITAFGKWCNPTAYRRRQPLMISDTLESSLDKWAVKETSQRSLRISPTTFGSSQSDLLVVLFRLALELSVVSLPAHLSVKRMRQSMYLVFGRPQACNSSSSLLSPV